MLKWSRRALVFLSCLILIKAMIGIPFCFFILLVKSPSNIQTLVSLLLSAINIIIGLLFIYLYKRDFGENTTNYIVAMCFVALVVIFVPFFIEI